MFLTTQPTAAPLPTHVPSLVEIASYELLSICINHLDIALASLFEIHQYLQLYHDVLLHPVDPELGLCP